jgi:hypothetical protein
MQDPFQTFLGAEPTDAAPLPPSAMSPGADGMVQVNESGQPWSPQDAQQVQAENPLAVRTGGAAVAVEAPPSNMNKYLLIGGALLVAYLLFNKKG